MFSFNSNRKQVAQGKKDKGQERNREMAKAKAKLKKSRPKPLPQPRQQQLHQQEQPVAKKSPARAAGAAAAAAISKLAQDAQAEVDARVIPIPRYNGSALGGGRRLDPLGQVEERPSSATNPKKSMAKKYESQQNSSISHSNDAFSLPFMPVAVASSRQHEQALSTTDGYTSAAAEPSYNHLHSAVDNVISSSTNEENIAAEPEQPHQQLHHPQVQPDYALESPAVVTTLDQATGHTFAAMSTVPEAAHPLVSAAGYDMSMQQQQQQQQHALYHQPHHQQAQYGDPSVFISGVETSIGPQDGMSFF
jgi:hypothetical protein